MAAYGQVTDDVLSMRDGTVVHVAGTPHTYVIASSMALRAPDDDVFQAMYGSAGKVTTLSQGSNLASAVVDVIENPDWSPFVTGIHGAPSADAPLTGVVGDESAPPVASLEPLASG